MIKVIFKYNKIDQLSYKYNKMSLGPKDDNSL